MAQALVAKAHAVADQADTLAHRGLDAVVQRSQALVQSGQNAQDATVAYIHREPVKSVLIAAAAGAGLMAVLTLLARRN
ncbi:MAG: hypothetical protein CFE43_17580 [Burkholderiales bacterium PBB3]|nr:MAG: hypothetical protein CFE43_17580 [Burkholderiales bacterium PBB3]